MKEQIIAQIKYIKAGIDHDHLGPVLRKSGKIEHEKGNHPDKPARHRRHKSQKHREQKTCHTDQKIPVHLIDMKSLKIYDQKHKHRQQQMGTAIFQIHIVDGALLFVKKHHAGKAASPERHNDQNGKQRRNGRQHHRLPKSFFLEKIEEKQRQHR